MTSVAIRTPSLFVSTIASPSKAACFGLSPISTTTAKPTETPTKLKSLVSEHRSNNDDDENQDSATPSGLQRSGSWTSSRAGFSPRPKRPNNHRHSHNPARRPVQSARSIHALRLAEQKDDDETEKRCEGEAKTEEALGRSNQAHLERIQEAEDSDDETENDDSDAPVDEYDGDGEEDEVLQLYKSFSGDLVARHTAAHRSHAAYDHDNDDVVRI